MKFGPVPLAEAEGGILAHSVTAGALRLRKGTVLTAAELARLGEAGVQMVTVARLEPGDIGEDEAAQTLAAALAGEGVRVTTPFTGRVNLEAASPGILRLDAGVIGALNAVDPGITLATLPDHARVAEGTMLATVKIIPYAVPADALKAAMASLNGPPMAVRPPVLRRADLILTHTPGFAEKLLAKGEKVVRERMEGLGVRLGRVETVAHDEAAVAGAVGRATAPLLLILGASATSDPRDVCPAGVVAAGGVLRRFGMPVDPGNLLFLADGPAGAVVGLPGCARSPALNGADWVLERLVCGEAVSDADIAGMGVGGLLKEIPIRPQPRAILSPPKAEPKVAILLLAAGAARRMRGVDKLTEPIDGQPLLTRSLRAALDAPAAEVIAVLPAEAAGRRTLATATRARVVTAERAADGMGASLAAGVQALGEDVDAVIVALADMPDVTAADYDRLISAFDPDAQAEICRATSAEGVPGHPVLFGRRFFEGLAALSGDTGARDILRAGRDFLVDVPLPGTAATTDLDTPEAWAAYRAGA